MRTPRFTPIWSALALGLLATVSSGAAAQMTPYTSVIPGQKVGGSTNIHVVSHVPLGKAFSGSDLEIEQELSRPYAYASVMLQTGTNIISLKDPARPVALWQWRIKDPELHAGTGAMDNKYFKLKGRYYDVQSLQFGVSGPDADVGAHVIDVTGLPDTTTIRDRGFIRASSTPGGFHNMFTYKHSDGRVLLFTTVNGPVANVYDMDKYLAGDPQQGLLGTVPGSPPTDVSGYKLVGYHDFYLAYDQASHRDLFYGAGFTSYYVYDVTTPEQPKLVTSITGAAGIQLAHTFTPDPTGRYVVTEAEYQYAPLRIFDLKPGLDGTVQAITRPIGAWNADWKDLVHNHEVRWPYVFVSGYEDGLQVFNMMDPTNPYTVGYYYTCNCPHDRGYAGPKNPEGGDNPMNGAFGVDVRNADGLIVLEDFRTGFWAFKMDGFDGWNGHQWGMPNVSSVQDWDHGPEGTGKPTS